MSTEIYNQGIQYHDLKFKQVSITMRLSGETKYTRWVDYGMPKIPETLINCVFYIYKTIEDATNGSNYGGTGFLVSVPSDKYPDKISYIYGVSNWHVVLNQGYSIIRFNKKDGKSDIFEFEPTEWEWEAGKDDIAVSPIIPINVNLHAIMTIHTKAFATKEIVGEKEIGVGDDVFMVGRFIDHDGGPTNLPAVRFGNISVMPSVIRQPTGYRGNSYCIDLHSRTGYSGSPVFVFRTPSTNLDAIFRTGKLQLHDTFLFLLGIHWGQFPELWEITCQGELPESAKQGLITEGNYIKGMSGMTCVIPSYRIMDLLNSPNLKNKRTVSDVQWEIKFRMEGLQVEPESAHAEDLEDS